MDFSKNRFFHDFFDSRSFLAHFCLFLVIFAYFWEIFFLRSKEGVGVRASGGISGLIFAFLNFVLDQFLKKLPKSLRITFKGKRYKVRGTR